MTARKHFWLSRRLLTGLVAVTLAYWTAIAGLTIRDSVDEIYQLFDVQLAQTAMALLRVTDPEDSDPIVMPHSPESPSVSEIFAYWLNVPPSSAKTLSAHTSQVMRQEYEQHLRYQVWVGDILLHRSPNAPTMAMTDRDGYSETADAQGLIWRHYGIWDMHHHVRILVSEAHDLRNRLVRNIAMHMAAPLLLGLPVLVALLWLSIGQGLKPLGALSQQIATKKQDNLLPLDTLNAPREVIPIVQALNSLLLHMNDSLESERRFTANAAHELRTPLAAIQAQLYVARSAASDDEREQAMTQLKRGVERGIRLVDQLLILARLDPEQSLPEVALVDLAQVAQNVCAEIAPLALQREQILELEVAPGLPQVSGNADMLSMLISNLIDNAIRYTQPGGHIRVNVSQCGSGLQLDVTDNGPGIPVAQREQVFERFYRIAAQSQPGTGLGLAICQRIAELHHSRVTLSAGPDGRGVTASLFITL